MQRDPFPQHGWFFGGNVAMGDLDDASAYLQSLIDAPSTTTRATEIPSSETVTRLAVATTRFSSGNASPNECLLFLCAVTTFSDALSEVMRASSNSSVTSGGGFEVGGSNVAEILIAAGRAATCIHRSDVSRSGIIPALAKIAVGSSVRPTASNHRASNFDATQPKTPASARDDRTQQHLLTPAHPELMQCCILAGQYSYAQKFALSFPVRSVRPSRIAGVTPETYLRYHYLLGLVRIGCDDYRGASAAFGICITVPSQVVSAITIAARKKDLLCRCLFWEEDCGGLLNWRAKRDGAIDGGASPNAIGVMALPALVSGELFDRPKGTGGKTGNAAILALPPSTSPSVSRFLTAVTTAPSSPSSSSGRRPDADIAHRRTVGIGAVAEPWGGRRREPEYERNYYGLGHYSDLAVSFAAGNRDAFLSAQQRARQLLEYDGNAGLVDQCESELRMAEVRAMASVYEVVSLDQMSKELNLSGGAAEAEAILMSIASNERVRRDCGGGPKLVESPFIAKIDQKSGMVYFHHDGTTQGDNDCDDDESEIADLTDRMRRCIELAGKIRALDVATASSMKYQQIVLRNRSSSGGNSGGARGSAPGPTGVADLDRPGMFD